MADEIVSLEDRAREKASKRSGPNVLGSVNDFCTRKEAIDAAVSVGRTVYDQVADEHGKSFTELERQLLTRIRALEAQTFAARWARVCDWLGAQLARLNARPSDYYSIEPEPHRPEDAAVPLPIVKEFEEWGVASDEWLLVGGVALGPDAMNPGPKARRLRCPSTEVLRLYAGALGADPAAIEDGTVSKAVEGEVLADVRRLVRGEVIKRADTKPELVP